MPCNDLTEILHLELDNKDRIKNYIIFKLSCSKRIGNTNVLLDWLKQKELSELLNINSQDMLREIGELDADQKFLCIKHFEHIKDALKIILGDEKGSKGANCIIHSYDQCDKGVKIKILINSNIDPLNNPGCGACSGCNNK